MRKPSFKHRQRGPVHPSRPLIVRDRDPVQHVARPNHNVGPSPKFRASPLRLIRGPAILCGAASTITVGGLTSLRPVFARRRPGRCQESGQATLHAIAVAGIGLDRAMTRTPSVDRESLECILRASGRVSEYRQFSVCFRAGLTFGAADADSNGYISDLTRDLHPVPGASRPQPYVQLAPPHRPGCR